MQILTSCRLCNHRRLNVITKQEQKRSKYRLWASPLTAGFMFLGAQQMQSIYGGHLETPMPAIASKKTPAVTINNGLRTDRAPAYPEAPWTVNISLQTPQLLSNCQGSDLSSHLDRALRSSQKMSPAHWDQRDGTRHWGVVFQPEDPTFLSLPKLKIIANTEQTHTMGQKPSAPPS